MPNNENKTADLKVKSIALLGAAMSDAICVLENTPDVDLEWNDEMQVRAKEGIMSAMETLRDGMKIIDEGSHKGDPCEKCGISHDDVQVGKCKPNVLESP